MKSITFGYGRVSTKEQNLDRQLQQLEQAGVDRIFTDKKSGKDFDRPEYQKLVEQLRENDTLVIVSLDRLGRNYTEVMNEWKRITDKGANIRVLDMPLLDTGADTASLDRRFIAQLVLEILCYVSEKERIAIHERQRQGIEAMPTDESGKRVSTKTGRPIGRPTAELPENWDAVIAEWKAGAITATEAIRRTGVPRTSFYKFAK